MNKIVNMFYFERVNTSLFRNGYHPTLLMLSSYIKCHDVATRFYINDRIENIYEYIDDIEFIDGDYILLFMDDTNTVMTKSIAKEMIENLDDKKIIILTDGTFEQSDEYDFDVISYTSQDRMIEELFQCLDIEVKPILPSIEIFNYYSREVLPLSETKNIGLNLDAVQFGQVNLNTASNLINEVKYIAEKTSNGQQILLETHDFASYEENNKLLKMLKKEELEVVFLTNILGNNLNANILKELEASRFIGLNIVIKEDKDIENATKIIIDKKLASFQFKLIVYMDGLDLNKAAFYINGWFSKKLITFKELELYGSFKNEKVLLDKLSISIQYGRYNALLNGMDLLFTGMYQDNISDGFIKHLLVENMNEFDTNSLEKLKNYISLNHGIYYLDNSESDEKFDYKDIIRLAEQVNYPLYNFMHLKRVNDRYQLYINGDYVLDVFIKKYSAMKQEKIRSHNNKYFTYLVSSEDLNLFKEDVDYYRLQGKIRNETMYYQLINMCRWVGFSSCFLHKMPRVLLKGGKFYSCETFQSLLGDVNDMQYETLQNIYIQRDKAEMTRDCLHCELGEHCSKCTILPEFINDNLYCNIRRDNNYISTYLYNIRFMRVMLDVSHTLKGKSVDELEFFCQGCKIDGEEIAIGNTSFLMPGVQAFRDSSKYYLFNPMSSSIMMLNETLYFITQLMIKKKSAKEIVDILSNKYSIQEETARETVKNALEMMGKKGCIKEMITNSVL